VESDGNNRYEELNVTLFKTFRQLWLRSLWGV